MITSSSAGRTALYIILVACCFSLAGCATMKDMFSSWTFGSDTEEETFEPAESLAVTGMDAYNVGNYAEALKAFNEIMDRHPFSPQAMLAELKAADSHYYKGEYVEAKTLYKEFEERHPTNEAIAYVMFQIGMCDFARTDRIDRDISGAQESIQSFSRLLRAYPNSPYTREAKARIRAAREFLVNHEYFVAVFYVRTKKYEQAQHRLHQHRNEHHGLVKVLAERAVKRGTRGIEVAQADRADAVDAAVPLEHLLDHHLAGPVGVLRAQRERVSWQVLDAGTLQVQFDVVYLLVRIRPGDYLA